MVFEPVAKTFGSMDATVEPPWMGSRRVFAAWLHPGHKSTVSPKSRCEGEFVMVFGSVAKTFGSMDATVEPPWMGLRRVFAV